MSNVTLKHTPSSVRKLVLLTIQSSSLRCVSAAEHHTPEQSSKMGRTKPRKHLSTSDLTWNTRQDFINIPCLREDALKTEQRFFSKTILGSNVTHNISRSPDSFSNGGDWVSIVRDLETIVLLAFNLIPLWSHHSLILPRSRIGDSATVTL